MSKWALDLTQQHVEDRITTAFDVFHERDFDYAQKYTMDIHKSLKNMRAEHEGGYGKYTITDTPELRLLHEKALLSARKYFYSETLLPSWNFLTLYQGPQKESFKETYDSACTYALQVPLYQRLPWQLNVNSTEHELGENEGIYFNGNTHERFRGTFPDPFENYVAEATFFFVEPDHWWFTKGENYLYEVIRAPKP